MSILLFIYFSILEIMIEIHDVLVFNDTCVRWQISPERVNARIVYLVSKGRCFTLQMQKWKYEPKELAYRRFTSPPPFSLLLPHHPPSPSFPSAGSSSFLQSHKVKPYLFANV